jgi:hypothetical protein
MKDLRSEVEKLRRDPETITDDLIKLFCSWALEVIGSEDALNVAREIRKIVGKKGKVTEDMVWGGCVMRELAIKKIEEVGE